MTKRAPVPHEIGRANLMAEEDDPSTEQTLRQQIEELQAALLARDSHIRTLEAEIATLEQQQWLREGCAGAGDFE